MSGDAEWHEVAEKFWPQWRRIFNEGMAEAEVSGVCPACGKQTLHRWYRLLAHRPHMFGDQAFAGPGPLWEWCSTCRSYVSFCTGYVPAEWVPPYDVELDTIPREPDLIERARAAAMR